MKRIVPDERAQIESCLMELADVWNFALVVTTGGTGFSPRDVTPEATLTVCERRADGIPEAMSSRHNDNFIFAGYGKLFRGYRERCAYDRRGSGETFCVCKLRAVIVRHRRKIQLGKQRGEALRNMADAGNVSVSPVEGAIQTPCESNSFTGADSCSSTFSILVIYLFSIYIRLFSSRTFSCGGFPVSISQVMRAKELKNKALREWRKKNPDKVRAASERYWTRRAQLELTKEVNQNGCTGEEREAYPDGR